MLNVKQCLAMAAMLNDLWGKLNIFLKRDYPKITLLQFSSNWLSFLGVVKQNVKISKGSNDKKSSRQPYWMLWVIENINLRSLE